MYRKNQIKFYVKDETGNKLFLNDDSNKILNKFNGVKKIINEVNCKAPSKTNFKASYSYERDKII